MTKNKGKCIKWAESSGDSGDSGDSGGAGGSSFDKLKGATSNPITNYSYSKQIKGPGCDSGDYCFSPSGGKIVHNTEGLLGYVNVLLEGTKMRKGADKNYTLGPFGFINTGATCKDTKTGKTVPRYTFSDYRATGNIPFLSSAAGVNFSMLTGLIPGMVETAAKASPMGIVNAFSEGPEPDCSEIRMLAMDNSGNINVESRHVLDSDIKRMNPCEFHATQSGKFTIKSKEVSKKNRTNPLTGDKCEGFQNLKTKKLDYSKLPDDNFVKFYYSVITLLGLYIVLKLLFKKHK